MILKLEIQEYYPLGYARLVLGVLIVKSELQENYPLHDSRGSYWGV